MICHLITFFFFFNGPTKRNCRLSPPSMSPFTHILPPDAPQLVNLLLDPLPPSSSSLASFLLLYIPASQPSPPTPPPQSAVLFLESLFGQENVYTMGMVRNLRGNTGRRDTQPEHDCDGVCAYGDVCMGMHSVVVPVSLCLSRLSWTGVNFECCTRKVRKS